MGTVANVDFTVMSNAPCFSVDSNSAHLQRIHVCIHRVNLDEYNVFMFKKRVFGALCSDFGVLKYCLYGEGTARERPFQFPIKAIMRVAYGQLSVLKQPQRIENL